MILLDFVILEPWK